MTFDECTMPMDIGGIAVASVDCTIQNCENNGSITIESAPWLDLGGILGLSDKNTTISYCTNTANINFERSSSTAYAYVGGIAGNVEENTDVSHCTNSGALKGHALKLGGIIGQEVAGNIDNCLNKGTVENLNDRTQSATGGISGSVRADAPAVGVVQNNISMGIVSAVAGQYGPIAGNSVNNVQYANNHYLAAIESSPETEITGATQHDSITSDVIDTINTAGGDYRLDENGNVEVVPLSHTLTIEGSEAETTGAGSYEAGTKVTIDAGTKSGYDFAGWTSTAGSFADASAAQTAFTMPAEDVTITANWKERPSTPSGPIIPSKPDEDIDIDESDHGSVEVTPEKPKADDEVVITPTPDEGYSVDDVIVKDEDGNVVDVTDNGDGSFTFTMPEGGVTITVTFKEKTASVLDIFNDLVPGAWYIDAVQYAYDHGLMTGTSATTFSPNATTTRGMIVAILHRQEGEPVVNYLMTFDDVAEGAYYAEAVRWAASEGVVNGYSASAFGPADAITREQLAAIFYNYAAYKGMDTSARADLSGYSDAARVSAWAEDAISWAVEEGLLRGVTSDTLEPQGAATRAQVAAILQRFLEA